MKNIVRFLAFVCLVTAATVASAAQSGDVVKFGQGAIVGQGVTVDNAVTIAGDLKIDGEVAGDAVAILGNMTVGSTGKVKGNAVVIFGKLIKESGAEISDKTFEFSLTKFGCGKSCLLPLLGIWVVGVGLVVFIGFGAIFLLIAALFTHKVGKASSFAERHLWRSFYYGFIAFVLILPITIFLLISVVGIPLVPLLFIILSAATLFGYAVMSQLIGLYFFRYLKKPGQPMVIEVLIGFLILAAISFVPVVGALVKIAVWMAGLGATIATRFGTVTR